MAQFNSFFKNLMVLEGGFVDDPKDHGGATFRGLTLYTWEKSGWDKNHDDHIDIADLKLITPEDAAKVYKLLYWDYIKGDEINSQSIAEIIFDWAVNSGTATATKKVQSLLGIKADGVFGPNTLKAVNQAIPQNLFELIKSSRIAFYASIIKRDPSQIKFKNGWNNRIQNFIFKG